jgi:thiamine biosynthesis lipoprotein
MITFYQVAAICAASALGLAPGAGRAGEGGELRRFEYREPHMGTEFKLVLYSTDEAAARLASRAAFDRIEDLNAKLSDYDPESELMRLCERAGGPPVPVGDDLFRVLESAQEFSRISDGAFDVTISPVGRLWRRARRDRKMPDPELLARARTLVDYRNVVLDPAARTVLLRKPGMKLDLGGIAKGYASDRAMDVLQSHGIRHALVAAAGDIKVSEPPPGSEGWVVAVAPLEAASGGEGPGPSLRLTNQAVSTSGDAERFVEIGGVRYSHILDPRSGLGVVGRSSATVVAPDATMSDALATILSILGPEKGMELIEQTPGAAAFYVRATDEGFQTIASRRWDAIPKVSPEPGGR